MSSAGSLELHVTTCSGTDPVFIWQSGKDETTPSPASAGVELQLQTLSGYGEISVKDSEGEADHAVIVMRCCLH